MTKLSTSGTVREILTNDPEMQADEVIRLAKAQGLRVPDEKIRHSIHNQRNTIRAKVGGVAKVAPSAAHETSPPKATHAAPASPSATSASELSGVLANVALVNTIVGLCGSVENARAVAEAVRACGSVDEFLQHLELVAGIRSDKSK